MIKYTKKIAAAAAVMTMTGALFGGCGTSDAIKGTESTSGDTQSKEASSQKTDSKELETVTLMLDWTPNTNHTGIYVAKEKGWYEENGIDLQIIEAAEEGCEAAVAGGAAEFGISFQDTAAPAFATESPLPITAVAAIIQHNTSGIISLADAGIEKPSDMAGHSYATWDLPVEQAVIKKVVEDDGGNYEDIELISTYVENIVAGLNSDIDSVWIYYAWDGIKTEIEGLDTNFFYFKDYGEELDYYSPVIIANNDFLAQHADLARAFLAATKKGYEYAVENPDDAAQILVDENEGLDLELCKKSQEWLADQYIADAGSWGVIDPGRWNAFYNWLNENQLVETEIPENTGFSNDYLQ